MSRRKSWVWKYASPSEDDTQASCKICGDVISYNGSTSALNKHLKQKHKLSVPIDTNNSVEAESSEEIDELPSTLTSASGSTDITEISRKRRRTAMESAIEKCSHSRQESISNALAQMVAKCQLPLSFVHSDGFVEFMKILVPGYQVPYPQAIRARLELAYDTIRHKISEHITKASVVAITTDEWSCRTQNAYLSVTVHIINSEWILNTYTLATINIEDRPTADNLAAVLQIVQEEWGLCEKLHAVVHDNASSIKAAVRLLTNVKHSINCAAHTLQLCIKDALNNVSEYCSICEKASKLVSHFKHSNVATNALKNKQNQLGLKEERLVQSCPTRWDSTYMMCDTLWRNRSAVCGVLTDRAYTSPAIALKLEMLEYDWLIMEEMLLVLKPLQTATKIFCSDSKVTLSAVRPIISSLIENHFKENINDSGPIIIFKNGIVASLTERFNMKPASTDFVTAEQLASFLDPRYKDLRAETDIEAEKINTYVQQEIIKAPFNTTEVGTCESEAETDLDFIFTIPAKSSNPICQYRLYLAEPQIGHNMDPLKWWKAHEESYPAIAEQARKYLGIPATSASSERVFSTAGNIVTAKRNCLSTENVNLLVFLHMNKSLF